MRPPTPPRVLTRAGSAPARPTAASPPVGPVPPAVAEAPVGPVPPAVAEAPVPTPVAPAVVRRGTPSSTSRKVGRPESAGRAGPPAGGGRGWAGTALARLSAAPGVVSTQLAERLAERRAARRRVRIARAAVLAVVGVVAASLAWLVLGSPLLALRPERVMVTSSAPSADEALAAAAIEPWYGTPLARLRTGSLEEAVERVPGVRSASVRRAWPNGLVVDVEGRVPVVAVPTGGRLALLDLDGVRVGALTASAPPGIPVVSLPPGRSVDGLTAVLAVLDALPPELLAEVDEVYAGSAETVRFRLVDGSRVEWGGAELSDLKVAVLTVLRQRPAQLYDVSAPTMPVTR